MAFPGRLPRVVPDSLTEPFVVDDKIVPGPSPPRPTPYTQILRYGARMPVNSDLAGGSALRVKAWINTSVPFQKAQGCALVKSECQRQLFPTKKIYVNSFSVLRPRRSSFRWPICCAISRWAWNRSTILEFQRIDSPCSMNILGFKSRSSLVLGFQAIVVLAELFHRVGSAKHICIYKAKLPWETKIK